MSKNAAAPTAKSQDKPKKVTMAEAAIVLDEMNETLTKQIEEIKVRQAELRVMQAKTGASIAETRKLVESL